MRTVLFFLPFHSKLTQRQNAYITSCLSISQIDPVSVLWHIKKLSLHVWVREKQKRRDANVNDLHLALMIIMNLFKYNSAMKTLT